MMINARKLLVVFAAFTLISNVVPAQAATLQPNPKLGGCYLFTEKELNSAYPLTNPIDC